MTDMHREAFEREAITWDMSTKKAGTKIPVYLSSNTAMAWCFWQAAIRHLTEQNEQRDSHE
jgi:hypothetical protein